MRPAIKENLPSESRTLHWLNRHFAIMKVMCERVDQTYRRNVRANTLTSRSAATILLPTPLP
jgi:hypothetical protein